MVILLMVIFCLLNFTGDFHLGLMTSTRVYYSIPGLILDDIDHVKRIEKGHSEYSFRRAALPCCAICLVEELPVLSAGADGFFGRSRAVHHSLGIESA
jgi:hypothetical protein